MLLQKSSSIIAASQTAAEQAALSAARQRWRAVQKVRSATARWLGMPPDLFLGCLMQSFGSALSLGCCLLALSLDLQSCHCQ